MRRGRSAGWRALASASLLVGEVGSGGRGGAGEGVEDVDRPVAVADLDQAVGPRFRRHARGGPRGGEQVVAQGEPGAEGGRMGAAGAVGGRDGVASHRDLVVIATVEEVVD